MCGKAVEAYAGARPASSVARSRRLTGGAAVRRVEIAERRARLGVRHRLAREAMAADLAEVAAALAGLHATDPASMFLAARSRMRAPDLEALERSL